MSDRTHIAALIPHAGRMCLLDHIIEWDDTHIVCATATHCDPHNPLRHGDRLAAVHLAEYGAQAMAVHGGLLAEREGRHALPGMLVSIRDLQLAIDRLDTSPTLLTISATKLVADANGWMYSFIATIADRPIGSGRVAVLATTAAA
jgi:predicted hotdog family 3-hydroxylacyl-ACP dehydratase